ncbi:MULTISPECIES: lamin tail domain-containing protein [Chryseobacterium]|uniref:Por secretion system C-terminal sorting domain n=1 Tax=Chryseobacterium taihuense TaxID=1141221 RepID=A0A4U8WAX1_9FLAO|nr:MULTISPECIES: lamin tail domain-containing protein [Chryseobacterium]QQV03327.1 lamin tail domain-containing protein [Chryseobacterium sp. FDAARGOS 1104]VFB03362.1 Por secretion system C-terminal sorting domain [Chryseobacterium taihuense]
MKKVFTFIGLVSISAFSNAQIVINEIYTGGGLLGAAITNDFIELKNIGNSTASLNGATIQYASSTGAFTQYNNLPNITLAPGQTYLIQQGSDGLGGLINLINPNLVVSVLLNFDGSPGVGVGVGLALTSGKVALASNATQVTGPTAANVLDFVGYGLANQYEGAGAAPSPTILNSITRTNGDTNNNNVDFTITLPTPQASGTLAVNDLQNAMRKYKFVQNTFVKNDEILFGTEVKDIKVYTLSGQLVKTSSVRNNLSLNVAELQKGNYIVTGVINNQPVSQKIIKD